MTDQFDGDPTMMMRDRVRTAWSASVADIDVSADALAGVRARAASSAEPVSALAGFRRSGSSMSARRPDGARPRRRRALPAVAAALLVVVGAVMWQTGDASPDRVRVSDDPERVPPGEETPQPVNPLPFPSGWNDGTSVGDPTAVPFRIVGNTELDFRLIPYPNVGGLRPQFSSSGYFEGWSNVAVFVGPETIGLAAPPFVPTIEARSVGDPILIQAIAWGFEGCERRPVGMAQDKRGGIHPIPVQTIDALDPDLGLPSVAVSARPIDVAPTFGPPHDNGDCGAFGARAWLLEVDPASVPALAAPGVYVGAWTDALSTARSSSADQTVHRTSLQVTANSIGAARLGDSTLAMQTGWECGAKRSDEEPSIEIRMLPGSSAVGELSTGGMFHRFDNGIGVGSTFAEIERAWGSEAMSVASYSEEGAQAIQVTTDDSVITFSFVGATVVWFSVATPEFAEFAATQCPDYEQYGR